MSRKAACPARTTLSRLPRPDNRAKILCLGRGGAGMIVRTGDCVEWPSNMYTLAVRAACTGTNYRIVALAEKEAGCKRPASPFMVTGHDRYLCLRLN